MTAWHAPTTAESPDAHSRLTVTPATVSGRPASSAAQARDVAVVLARLVGAAEPDVLDLRPGDAGALDRGGDGERREVVGPHVGEPAAVAADGRPHGGEDHRATHRPRLPSSSSNTPLRDRERPVRGRDAAVDRALEQDLADLVAA